MTQIVGSDRALGRIFEPKIPLGTTTGTNLFSVNPLGVANVMQQTGDSIGRYRNTETGHSWAMAVVVRREQRNPAIGSPAASCSRRQWRTAIMSGVSFVGVRAPQAEGLQSRQTSAAVGPPQLLKNHAEVFVAITRIAALPWVRLWPRGARVCSRRTLRRRQGDRRRRQMSRDRSR
jgi:hypothetical protein